MSMKLSLSELFVSKIIVTMVISNKSCCKHVLFTNLSDFISTTTRVTSLKSKKFLFCSFSVAKFGIAPGRALLQKSEVRTVWLACDEGGVEIIAHQLLLFCAQSGKGQIEAQVLFHFSAILSDLRHAWLFFLKHAVYKELSCLPCLLVPRQIITLNQCEN